MRAVTINCKLIWPGLRLKINYFFYGKLNGGYLEGNATRYFIIIIIIIIVTEQTAQLICSGKKKAIIK